MAMESNSSTMFPRAGSVRTSLRKLMSVVLEASLALTFAVLFLKSQKKSSTESTRSIALTLLILVLAEAGLYTIYTVVYRLWFHPLARYPGPTLGKITDWYSVYHCWQGDRHIDFYNLHCKYGNIVRFGPTRISMNTNTALHDIYNVRANVQKSQFFAIFSHFFKEQMSMTTIDKKKHAFKRRIDAEALTGSALKGYEPQTLNNIRKFCQHLIDQDTKGWSKARNLTQWTSYLLSDVMGDNTFSRNWNMMDSEENRNILDVLAKGVAGLHMTGHMPGILQLKLDKIIFRKLTEGTYQYHALSKSQTEWRLSQQDNIKAKDLFAALLEARDPESGRGFTQEEMIAEAGLLMIAGSSTSASAIAATLFYCLHYPSTFGHLQREIRATFDDVESIRTGPRMSSCQYLKACIDEAMRLSPGVAGMIPREVLRGGITIDGNFFPVGSDIGVPNYALHHNEDYFPEPFVFNPERWIVNENDKSSNFIGSSKADVSLAYTAFAPFSKGESSCVGMNLAYNTMSTTIARMVYLYDMRLQPGSTAGEGHPSLGSDRRRREEFQCQDKFVSIHDGPMVEFKPRDVFVCKT